MLAHRWLSWSRYLPESVALVLVGLLLHELVPAVRTLISSELVLLVFVPGLVFDAAFDLEWRLVRPLLPALAGLAAPGVVVSALVVAVALRTIVGMPIELAFVVGAITAATDPVAVVATLTRLRMPERLRTLIEGESLLNDGTGLVLVAIAVTTATRGLALVDAVTLFVITIAFSIGAGFLAGAFAAFVLRRARHPAAAFVVTAVLAYGTFLATSFIEWSGVLATVVGGATLGYLLRRRPEDATIASRLDGAWAIVAFVLSGVTFLSIGAAIDLHALGDAFAPIAVGVLAVVAARALIVYVPFAAARPRMAAGSAHVLFWSGLRGAIAFAAALALPAGFPRRDEIQAITFGVVLVTLVVQGVTAPLVVRLALPHGSD